MTGTVRFRLIERGQRVEINIDGLRADNQAEIDAQLRNHGASGPTAALRMGRFEFRRATTDLAGLLRRSGATPVWDDAIRGIFQLQARETRARREAVDLVPFDEPTAVGQVTSSGRFTRALTERQIGNLGRLLALPHGANFSVPGAGKTTTLLAVYEAVRGRGEVDRLLIVGPKNAFVSWENEVLACFPDDTPSVVRAAGGRAGVEQALRGDPEIVLITYQMLANVPGVLMEWAQRHRTHIVLDESHRTKSGFQGVQATAAVQLAASAARRDILTGTPLPHQPEDLRAQLGFLWPGQRILPTARVRADSAEDVLAQVERSVAGLYVRTTKRQLRLPALNIEPVRVTLAAEQRRLYEVLRTEAARSIEGLNPTDRTTARSLGRQVVRLLQASTNPRLLLPSLQASAAGGDLIGLVETAGAAKLDQAIALAERAISDGRRVLLWSGFLDNIAELEARLTAHGPVVITGQVPAGDSDDDMTREGRIRRFHEDDGCRVMIANPAAAGEGISLHLACQYAVYVDRTFNAAHFMQSVDRIHRLGSVLPSQVHVLQADATIDIRVQNRLATKIDVMRRILDDAGLAELAYDPDDAIDLFPGGIDPGDFGEIIAHLNEPGPDD